MFLIYGRSVLMLGFAFGLTFCVPNFKAIGVRVYTIFASVRKHEKKNERKKIETLAARISEMAGAISFKFGM